MNIRLETKDDYIQVEDTIGKVVNMGFRTTQLETIEGNIVTIPNSALASSHIINMTSGQNEVSLVIEEVIDIYADYEKAKQLMIETVKETKDVIINKDHVPFVIVDRVTREWSMSLKLFITVKAPKWHIIQSNIKENIKKEVPSWVKYWQFYLV